MKRPRSFLLFAATLGILASSAAAQDRQAEHLNAGIQAVFAKNPYLYEGDSCVLIPKPKLNETWVVAVGEAITSEPGLAAKRKSRNAASIIADRLIGELLTGQSISGATFLSESEVSKNDEVAFESFFKSTTKSQMQSFLIGIEDMGSWQIEEGGERGFYRVRGVKLPLTAPAARPPDSPAQPSPPSTVDQKNASDTTATSPSVDADGMIVVVVVGVAEYMGNVNYSRQEAVKAATMEALKKALGVAIQGEKVVQDGELVLDQVYEAMPQGSLQNYDLLEEDHDDSEYRVTIRARVSREAIVDTAQNIGMLMSQVGKPKVAVIHKEQLDEVLLPFEDSVVRMVIDDLFSQPPWYIRPIDVHQRMITRKTQAPEQWAVYEKMMKEAGADAPLDARLAAECGIDADILVKGTAEVTSKGKDSDGVFDQYEVNVFVQVVMGSTGETMGTVILPGIVANGDSPKSARLQAINKAKPKLEPLIEKTIRQLKDMAKNGMMIRLTMMTPDGMKKRSANRHGRKVRDLLKALPKVKEVQYGKEGGIQDFTITFVGTPSDFADLFEEYYEDEFGDWLDDEDLDYGMQRRGSSLSMTIAVAE
ncbi:MAG: hypothetical protein QF471_04495 [Phycisphaerales bacterium]|nr:hypothetical protein [Phycisphaerales bacterium]